MISWTAAILAGGRARRLGGIDKSALVVGARSILDRQLSLMHGLTSHLLIVTNDRSRVQVVDVPVVVDRIGGAGALGGLYTALVEAPTEQVLIIGCDMPFLTAPFLRYLAERGRDADAAVPRDSYGRHPLCASYVRRTAALFPGPDPGRRSTYRRSAGRPYSARTWPRRFGALRPGWSAAAQRQHARRLRAGAFDGPHGGRPGSDGSGGARRVDSVPQRKFNRKGRSSPVANITRMILPVHERLRAHLQRLLGELYSLDQAAMPADPARIPPEPRSRRSRHPGRLRARSPAAEGAAGHRAGDRGLVRHDRRCRRGWRRRRTAT